MRLGRGPRLDDSRTIQLRSLLTSGILAAPAKADFTAAIQTWPMFANNAKGDCTCSFDS